MWSFPEVFQGRFIRLRPLSLEDAPLFWARYDPEAYRYMSLRPEPSLEGHRAYLQALLEEPGRVNWSLWLGEELAGRISVIEPSPKHRRLELGTLVFPPFWGGPVNLEAKLLLLTHAFEALGAGRVQFKVDGRNLRSQRALEKLGAVREGVLRRHRLVEGEARDDVVYSILAEEWPGVKANLLWRLEKF